MSDLSGKAICLLICAALAGGCGGGSAPQSNNVTGTGAGQSALFVGTITGFGSVYVNGVKFDVTSARLSRNGLPAQQSELRVGQFVKVRGARNASAQTGQADVIEADDNVQGPVTAIDAVTSTLSVLGQTVHVDAATSWGDGINPRSLAGVAVGDVLEVSGMVLANGDIAATRIERVPATSEYFVRGAMANVDSAARAFSINQLRVDYATARIEGLANGMPSNGVVVQVHGRSLSATGTLTATAVEGESLAQSGDNRDIGDVEVEGAITRYVSAMDFDVNRQPVTTSPGTQFVGGTVADLKLDLRVEVEGQTNAIGVLVAGKVKFEGANAIALAGPIESIDRTAKRLTMLGITIQVADTTRVEDRDQRMDRFSIEMLNIGDYIRVRGRAAVAPAVGVSASKLERERAMARVAVRAPLTSMSRPNALLLGVAVVTGSGTQFVGSDERTRLTADQFFATPLGTLISVVGTQSGASILAERVEIESGNNDGGDDDLEE